MIYPKQREMGPAADSITMMPALSPQAEHALGMGKKTINAGLILRGMRGQSRISFVILKFLKKV